jgi:hypothetical protein
MKDGVLLGNSKRTVSDGVTGLGSSIEKTEVRVYSKYFPVTGPVHPPKSNLRPPGKFC